MKVAIIAGEIPSTTFIERLTRGLVKSGITVFLVGKINNTKAQRNGAIWLGPSKKHEKASYFIFTLKYKFLVKIFMRKDGMKLIQLNPNANATDYALLWHKPDIIHVQWAKALNQFMWVQKFGMKVVLSLRGTHINISPLAAPGLASMYTSNFPKVDGFHGVSKAICQEAQKYGADSTKCHVVYSGFDMNQFPKSAWNNYFEELPSREINILSVGRSHWKKGYHFALDAMRILKEEGFPFQYTIIGAAGNEELMFQRHQLELKNEVQFLDNVPFSEVKKMISAADVLLLPSVEEGIANVVLEAMFLGTLVLTTNCGGMEEVVEDGENGFMVSVRNSNSIANTVKKIYSTNASKLNAMVEEARHTVENQHAEYMMVNNMLKIYNTVASKHEQ